ncbi:hypothetical protein K438DRAFT_1760012 [Mycena galopus ATCC 62051]|nr:hypothetical protein K438DRAFT_1760012 [Mycena galopus ATCC 62051]
MNAGKMRARSARHLPRAKIPTPKSASRLNDRGRARTLNPGFTSGKKRRIRRQMEEVKWKTVRHESPKISSAKSRVPDAKSGAQARERGVDAEIPHGDLCPRRKLDAPAWGRAQDTQRQPIRRGQGKSGRRVSARERHPAPSKERKRTTWVPSDAFRTSLRLLEQSDLCQEPVREEQPWRIPKPGRKTQKPHRGKGKKNEETRQAAERAFKGAQKPREGKPRTDDKMADTQVRPSKDTHGLGRERRGR